MSYSYKMSPSIILYMLITVQNAIEYILYASMKSGSFIIISLTSESTNLKVKAWLGNYAHLSNSYFYH